MNTTSSILLSKEHSIKSHNFQQIEILSFLFYIKSTIRIEREIYVQTLLFNKITTIDETATIKSHRNIMKHNNNENINPI